MMKYKLFAAAATAAMIVGSGNVVAATATNPKVTGADVIDGSLAGADVQDNSLTGADIDETTLNGSQITGVNAATLNGNASSAFATAAALSALAARVTTLESTVAKMNGTAALTLADLAGAYSAVGYSSHLWTTPTPSGIPQPHLDLHTDSALLTVNPDGSFVITPAADCEAGTVWNGGSAATAHTADCDDVATGAIEIVGNGSTLHVWLTGAATPLDAVTVAGGGAWIVSKADVSDGTVTLLVFAKQN